MNKTLESKLKDLPQTPGVYFHKNAAGEIIYIGKAANLRNRVRQYFQASRYRDPKTDILVSEIADVDWTDVETEADALFLEAELVRRYKPRFNILLRDDKSQIYIRINYKSDYPTVATTRRPLDDAAEYFGPYVNGPAIKKALRYLRRAFPFAISRPVGAKRANLHYHLGLDPGLEEGRTSLADYRANLRKLMQYLRGERVALTREIERDMKRAAKTKDFEQAAAMRNQLFALRELNRQILFSDRELQDASRDEALVQLGELLGAYEDESHLAARKLRRIEGFDISHMQGTDTVASMVVFNSGLPDKASYRKFKMRLAGNDDFAHMSEVIVRRLRPENQKKWGLPDLMLIDGGKGQLSAALDARDKCDMAKIPMIGLAKRFEQIIIKKPGTTTQHILPVIPNGGHIQVQGDYWVISLPSNSPVVKLLQRIRDESHRFALSYHSILKRTRQTHSVLDEIPGIGPLTRKKLIRSLGSARGVAAASQAELTTIVGPSKAKIISQYTGSQNV